jgi:hypothetical protein
MTTDLASRFIGAQRRHGRRQAASTIIFLV